MKVADARTRRIQRRLRRTRSQYGRLVRYMKAHAVFFVALLAALVTLPFAFFGDFPKNPLESIDLRTLACLFCILGAVGELGHARFFELVASMFSRAFPTLRITLLAIVATTMVLSMLVTNDMALVVMLPLAAAVLRHEKRMSAMPFCFIMQNLAANLGGMILPFGNPQNLFIYGKYGLDFSQFASVMWLPFAVSVALIGACCLVAPAFLGRNLACEQAFRKARTSIPEKGRLAFGFVLLLVAILAVFRAIPYVVAFACVLFALIAYDRKVLRDLDWLLLGTFACFFVFSGNICNIGALQGMLAGLMDTFPLLTSAGASQLISNVPAAILLSNVAEGWQQLLVGVNIGGAGTIVASLATLITIDKYKTLRLIGGPSELEKMPSPGKFMLLTMAWGFGFLVVLIAVCSF